MNETRLRAIIREEIALAMKTLSEVAGSAASSYGDDRTGERDGSFAIESAAGGFFESAYEADCAVADEQRAEHAADPFEETKPGEAVDAATKAFVHAEVQNVLREMRDTFRMSGRQDDLQIADRLDYVITARERIADE